MAIDSAAKGDISTGTPGVRSARRSDLPQLLTLYNHWVENSVASFDFDPRTAQEHEEWFATFAETGPHRLLVACDGPHVVGCAASGPYRRHPAFAKTVEFSVYVRPDVRSKGAGSALYGALLDLLQSEPVHVVLAGIALPNEASIRLHRRFGFTDVGVFEEYAEKRGTYISSLWMQRRL